MNITKMIVQNTRPAIELARLIRRIPWDGEFENQFLIISNALFSFSDGSGILISNTLLFFAFIILVSHQSSSGFFLLN